MASYFSLLTFVLGLSMVFAGGYDYGGHGHGYGYNKGAPHAEPYGAKPYQHYGHYHYAKTTCADHYKPGVKNGYFKVYSVYHMGSMNVYCDFTSEPGMAYTMVMSSTEEGREGALVITDPATPTTSIENPFLAVSLATAETATVKHHVNSNIPNKFAYRQARVDMERISKASKVWRMTCMDEYTDAATFTGYIRMKVSEYNPVTAASGTQCKTAEYVNARDPVGSCANCKVNVNQDTNIILQITNGCDTPPLITGDILTEECPSGSNAALWFGKPVH